MTDKQQLLVGLSIFAVLSSSKLCNVLLCNYKIHLSSFSILKIAALRCIWLSKIKNLNFTSGAGDQHASLCQISSKSVKRLQRYGDLTVFKMVSLRHLGFLKFKFLTVGAVKRPILHHRTKFRKNRSNRCGNIAIFVIFNMVAAILDFPPNWKF